jgi:hypothetical protein
MFGHQHYLLTILLSNKYISNDNYLSVLKKMCIGLNNRRKKKSKPVTILLSTYVGVNLTD